MRAHTYLELVEMFREGPPWWNPTRIGPIDEISNIVEFYVHSEDVRRTEPVLQRDKVSPRLRARFWVALRVFAFAGLRHVPVGVIAERTDEPGRIRLRRGYPEIVLAGPPEELLLYVSGRRSVADVAVYGDEDVTAAFEQAPTGI
jgi:uncharacterized protein (TIGR03085 family)